jgi:hypothetical protein
MIIAVKKSLAFLICIFSLSYGYSQQKFINKWEASSNPVVTHKYTCDPAALVFNDTLFIFTGEDAKGGQTGYNNDKPDGPYTYKGVINEIAGNSNTNHQSIIEYKANWYFIYHNGGIQTDGGSYSRSMCIDKLEFDKKGMYKPILMTTKGVDKID